MNKDCLVSIIVPIYNVGNHLEQCIKSLINQTYKNIEIVLVDDGSKDCSGVICDSFAKQDKRIIVVHKENGGLSSARRRGMEEMTGQYAMFVDGDDWIDKTMVEKMINIAEMYDSDCVCCGYIREYGTFSANTHLFSKDEGVNDYEFTEKFYRRLFGLNGEDLKTPERCDSIVSACMKLYRYELIKSADYVDEKIIGTGEDVLLNISALKNCNHLCYLNECLYHYRRTDMSSITQKYKENLDKKWEKLFDCVDSYITKYELPLQYNEALNNRIALSVIGLGLNIVSNINDSFLQKKKKLGQILCKERYCVAYSKLNMSYFPIKWKVFFWACKKRITILVLILLEVMEILRKKKIN